MSAHRAGQQIMRSVLHTTPYTHSKFSPARSNSTSACVWEGAQTGSFFQRTLGFIRAIAGQKLHLQFLHAIPLFTFTHDSCVMSTICQRCVYWLLPLTKNKISTLITVSEVLCPPVHKHFRAPHSLPKRTQQTCHSALQVCTTLLLLIMLRN